MQQADDQARVVAVNHEPTSMRLGLKLGSLTARAAFSHIPFLHSAHWMLDAIMLSAAPPDLQRAQPPAEVVATLRSYILSPAQHHVL